MQRSLSYPATEPTTRLSDALLTTLESARAYPSVSVLLTTVPGDALSTRDSRKLFQLLDRAAKDLESLCNLDTAVELKGDLQQMAAAARRAPVRAGLALFTGGGLRAVTTFPVAVADRIVVGDTFATNDLRRAQAHLPLLRLLAISERAAHLYEGWPHYLDEVVGDGFPIWPAPRRGGPDRSYSFGRDRSASRRRRLEAHFRQVDEALAARSAVLSLPLIVAGVPRHLAAMTAMPAVGRDVIGTIRGGHHHRDRARLARLGRPIVYRHQQGVRRRALAQLDGEGRRVDGLDAVWCAAFEGRVRLLCVEERHALTAPPLQRDPAGFGNIAEHHRLPAAAADDAIKQVARSGGQTVIVDDGALAGSEGIAAVSWARS